MLDSLSKIEKTLNKLDKWIEKPKKKILEINWKPLAGPQMMAYESLADETFYGGAAGGGKTDLILGLALTRHQNSIIFRREYPQLKAIIQRSKKIIALHGKYNGTDKIWQLDDGRILEFGACQREEDVEKFQGRAHDLKAFDEITHFSRYSYKFLSGWNRTADENIRARTICTGNPPTTAEGRWIIEYWAPWLDSKHPNPAVPGELRWFVVVVDESSPQGRDMEVSGPDPVEVNGEFLAPRSRTFIPAKIDDNPYYAKTNYRAVLMGLPEPLRSQMLKGDFGAGVEDDPWQVIPTEWVKLAFARWKLGGKPKNVPLTSVGADIARGGAAKTIFAPRYGNFIDKLHKHPGKTTPNGGAIASLLQTFAGDAQINIDITGVGSSPYDSCIERGLNAFAANGACSSDAKDKSGKLGFINKRAEWYWHIREILDPANQEDIALPDDPELLADLTAPRWKITSSSKIQIESKQDIQSRIGRSPDCGDAVVYAFAEVESSFWSENVATW